jgi:phage terminase small subunit
MPPRSTKHDDPLTPKQRAFVSFYMTNGFNGGQAAIAAGYSEDTAYEIASENLRKPLIRDEINRMMRDYVMPPEEILARLTAHARGDLGDIYDETTGQVSWEKVRARGLTSLVKKIKHTTKRTTLPDGTDIEIFDDEIELHSVQNAMQLLGKQHALFADKLKIEITWQDETVSLIKAGQLDYKTALETFDHDDELVRRLFAKAEVSIQIAED